MRLEKTTNQIRQMVNAIEAGRYEESDELYAAQQNEDNCNKNEELLTELKKAIMDEARRVKAERPNPLNGEKDPVPPKAGKAKEKSTKKEKDLIKEIKGVSKDLKIKLEESFRAKAKNADEWAYLTPQVQSIYKLLKDSIEANKGYAEELKEEAEDEGKEKKGGNGPEPANEKRTRISITTRGR